MLKSVVQITLDGRDLVCFSALQRAEIAEIWVCATAGDVDGCVSVLFNEPKLLKLSSAQARTRPRPRVSVLFNEPKLLKLPSARRSGTCAGVVSVLFNEPKLLKSRRLARRARRAPRVSVLFNEPKLLKFVPWADRRLWFIRFSALQRAEIAEIIGHIHPARAIDRVSVLFNEPKLLKCISQRYGTVFLFEFQCSSTSRNC